MYQFHQENFSIIPGDIFSGIITHVVNSEIIYLVKSEASVMLCDLEEHLMKSPPEKIFWIPSVNEKFLIHLNDEYFRAKRVALTADQIDAEFMQIILLDSGDTILAPIRSNDFDLMETFFMIPKEFDDVPPIAKKCKWIEDEKSSDEKEKFLKDSILNKILTFEALKIKGDTIHVKIWPYEQQLNYEIGSETNKVSALDKPIFTKEELDDLYEEPLNTENALVAVQGYATQDDEKLCQFYDPKTGGCFKGAACKLKHLPKSDDPYDCRDRIEVFVRKDDYDTIELNKHYNIEITSFLAVNRILFRFADPKYNEKYEEIQEKINKLSEVKSYKKISILPAVTELVIVKINGEFFRAKIIEEVSDYYVVWCLDVGCLKTANINMLYEWVFRLQDFKYLTHEMEITNLLSIKGNQKKAMLRIMDIKDQTGNLFAFFKKIGSSFAGRLCDGHKNDIGEILIKEGLAAKNNEDFTEGDCKGLLPL